MIGLGPMPQTAMPPGSAVAEIAGLQVRFLRDGRDVHALRGVDLKIANGEILGLVGESGSGKTVLGLSLLGLLPKAALVDGTVTVGGVDVTRADARTKRRVRRDSLGAVFQDPMTSLDPTMRIGRQVHEVAGSASEVVRMLEAVGIPDPGQRLRNYPHELSGGLRQRVMLAIALARGPRLVVADEPTTALDVTVQAQVLALLGHMRDEFGCAVLLVTHDLAVASTVADRVCVLYGGRVVELGAVDDVLNRPAHPYTAALLASRIGLRAERSAPLPIIAGEPLDATSTPAGCSFAPRCLAVADRCREERPLLVSVSARPGLTACHFEAGTEVAQRLATGAAPWAPPTAATRGGAITVRDARVRFPGRRGLRRSAPIDALAGVDLSVAAAEAVAVVGESGSGKTTLLRVLAGLQTLTSGTVERSGSRGPQMVFQDAGSSFTPWLTIGDHLAERVRHLPAAQRRQRVSEALTRLGLPAEVAGARTRELSGGQRQRAALARAVIEPPDLLLCDEPISALDASLAATVLNLLGRLRRELRFAMVFVTHDLAAARLVADRIVVMTGGRVVEEGPSESVVGSPEDPYTRQLLGSVPEVATCR